jgi:hypothetical protein
MSLRNRWFTLAAVLFALLCVAPLAQAQNLEVHAHIPFAFTVGDTSLPAGDYVLTQVEPDNPAAYALTDRAKNVEVVFETSDSGREEADRVAGLASPRLQFDTAGGKAFLTRLDLPSESLSRDVLTGTRYREMAPSVDWQPKSVTCVAAG